MELDRSTISTNLSKETDKKFPPKESLHTQASSNHHIKGVMGHDRLTLPINTKDLETNWHFFELMITGGELKNLQQQSLPISQPTKWEQLQLTMAPKMRGNINDTVKAKARAMVEAKKKEATEEKKLSVLK